MDMTRGWTGPRLALVALTLGLLFSVNSTASAASMSTTTTSEADYSTSGSVISNEGVVGPNVISFNSVAGGSFLAPSSFSLGEFLVAALPPGVTTSYTNTPFEITYIANKINGAVPTLNETPLKLTGVLNGKISGPNQSSVVATFNPIASPAFQTGDFLNTLSLTGTALLVPSSNNGGRSTIQGRIVSEYNPIPEPATITIFLTTLAGLGLRRRLRTRAV
jgi:hypothetical protein